MKILIAVALALASVCAVGQQTQTSDVSNTQSLFMGNAKYVQGIGPGYWPTCTNAGATSTCAGLTLYLTKGTVWCQGTLRTYAGGTLTMTNSTTNYVYLDPAANCAPAVSTSAFNALQQPIATVVAAGGVITSITDNRSWISSLSFGGINGLLQCAQLPTFTGDVSNSSCGMTVTALHLSVTPTLCGTGNYARGIDANGNATGCTSASSGSGTVTNIATTSPITGGTITTTGTIACPTCVTSAASLASGQLVAGAGGQASAVTNLTGDVTTSGGAATTLASVVTAGSCGDATHSCGLTYDAKGRITAATNNGVGVIRGISFTIGDPASTSSLTTGSTITDYVTVSFGCTISAYDLLIDGGTITVKFWKIGTGTSVPTSSNSINTSGVSISTGTALHSSTLSDFTTTTITADDIVAMNVTAVSTAKYVNGVIECQ